MENTVHNKLFHYRCGWQFNLHADRSLIKANGENLSIIIVSITDINGNVISHAKNNIQCSIEGPGEIVATDNGDPVNLMSLREARYYQNKCSQGLKAATIEIKSK